MTTDFYYGSSCKGVATISNQTYPDAVTISAEDFNMDKLDYDMLFDRIAKRFKSAPIVEHKCHNCGATLEIKSDEGIFKCPYCKSCYAVGTKQVNWRY